MKMRKYSYRLDLDTGKWIILNGNSRVVASFDEESHAIIFTKILTGEWSVITINAEESGLPQLRDIPEELGLKTRVES